MKLLIPQLKRYHNIFSMLFLILMIVGGGILNLKFVQIGIPQFGLDVLGVGENVVIISLFLMGLFALIFCVLTGWILDKYNVSFNLRRILYFLLSILNIGLIFLTYIVINDVGYVIWVICFGINLGISASIAYPFIFYLLPQKKRGLIAGILVALMYGIGASTPENWDFLVFRDQNIMFLPITILIVLFFTIFDVFNLEEIDNNAKLGAKFKIDIKIFIFIMAFILFADSFGFLRVIGDPVIYQATWGSTLDFRIYIGIVHAVSALLIGIFYDKLKFINIAMISAVLVVISDFAMGFFGFNNVIRYFYPLLYASGISTYTVILMAMISDISTESTINKNISFGFGFLGWFCTYLATSLSHYLMIINFSFSLHLIITSIIAVFPIIIGIYFKLKNKNEHDY